MKRPSQLEPLTVKTTHVLIPNTIGKFRVRYQLLNKTGTVLSADGIDQEWLQYIADCVNATPSTDPNVSETKQIMRLVIPGEHLVNRESKKIEKMPDGTLALAKSKAYAKKLRETIAKARQIIPDESLCPITYPVSVKCIFYMNMEKHRPFCLPEMTAQMLDILVKINVLDKATSDIVKDTNGSTVVNTSGDSMTVVYVYRIKGD